jgi:hypothetical protein
MFTVKSCILFVVVVACLMVRSATAADSDARPDGSFIRVTDDKALRSQFAEKNAEVQMCSLNPVQCENVGQGSCGGYNKDTKTNCDPCSRPTTYHCDDGSYQEACKADPACGRCSR